MYPAYPLPEWVIPEGFLRAVKFGPSSSNLGPSDTIKPNTGKDVNDLNFNYRKGWRVPSPKGSPGLV